MDRPGSRLRVGARSDADTLAWFERLKVARKALRELGPLDMVRAQDRALAQSAKTQALYLKYQADVAAQHLCRPSGADRSTENSSCVGSMENEQQQGRTVSGGSGGADVASCFPGSELHGASDDSISTLISHKSMFSCTMGSSVLVHSLSSFQNPSSAVSN